MPSVEERVVAVTARVLQIDPAEIKPEQNFTTELGAESVQSIELVAMFEEEFRPLEPLRELLADRLFNDPRPRESDERLRLRNDEIPEGGKTRQNPCHGGMGEYGEKHPAGVIQAHEGTGRLGHLHETQETLLHPCAAS